MSNFTERDKAAARAILSVFETGKEQGDPSAIAVLDDGAGVSFGLHQATHQSGSLEAVLREFARLAPVHQASALKWAEQLSNRTPGNVVAVGRNAAFKTWLRQAGVTAEMKAAQENVFDENYMNPALAECARCDFVEPLSLAIVYDAYIQGGWAKCRDNTNFQHKRAVPEKQWITDYLNVRTAYLKGLKSKAAQASVYRPQAFQALVRTGNWSLKTPFIVRGRTIEENEL
jgi:chitosanase